MITAEHALRMNLRTVAIAATNLALAKRGFVPQIPHSRDAAEQETLRLLTVDVEVAKLRKCGCYQLVLHLRTVLNAVASTQTTLSDLYGYVDRLVRRVT